MADKPNALLTAKPKNPRFESGTSTRKVEYRAVVSAANSDDGDIFILAGPLRFGDRIAAIRPGGQGTPALTGATNTDLGFFYKDADGDYVEIDADILWDGITLASALTYPNLLTGLNTSLDVSKNIGEHLDKGSDEQPHGGVYLVMTTLAKNTATGPLTLDLEIEIDEATTS